MLKKTLFTRIFHREVRYFNGKYILTFAKFLIGENVYESEVRLQKCMR